MKKIKIGKGYWPDGYGKNYKKDCIVWLINGKAYVKDSRSNPFQTDLKDYTMVNFEPFYKTFHAVSLIKEHKIFNY